MRIGIIGTAGRKDDAPRMSRALYERMYHRAHQEIRARVSLSEVTLVSGGAAWSDHIAVSLRLGKLPYENLHLHFPAPFVGGKYVGGRGSPGGTANWYHEKFSAKMGANTLDGISRVLKLPGVESHVYEGFHARNLLIADVDFLLAFTFSPGAWPKDGGTAHTWRNSRAALKLHVPLTELERDL